MAPIFLLSITCNFIWGLLRQQMHLVIRMKWFLCLSNYKHYCIIALHHLVTILLDISSNKASSQVFKMRRTFFNILSEFHPVLSVYPCSASITMLLLIVMLDCLSAVFFSAKLIRRSVRNFDTNSDKMTSFVQIALTTRSLYWLKRLQEWLVWFLSWSGLAGGGRSVIHNSASLKIPGPTSIVIKNTIMLVIRQYQKQILFASPSCFNLATDPLAWFKFEY